MKTTRRGSSWKHSSTRRMMLWDAGACDALVDSPAPSMTNASLGGRSPASSAIAASSGSFRSSGNMERADISSNSSLVIPDWRRCWHTAGHSEASCAASDRTAHLASFRNRQSCRQKKDAFTMPGRPSQRAAANVVLPAPGAPSSTRSRDSGSRHQLSTAPSSQEFVPGCCSAAQNFTYASEGSGIRISYTSCMRSADARLASSALLALSASSFLRRAAASS
mmetsp:Transcript_21858/g.61382  ORF Transcript_21858/g.61382 Transcript_21858/m.61382 type:complete len:222 (+) Transcript_21858:351-1016(+)